MKAFLFAASHRPASYNRLLIAQAESLLVQNGMTAELAEYGELDVPLYNAVLSEEGRMPPEVLRVAERLRDADLLVIASPEYNWSIPGSLKNLIDWLSHCRPSPLTKKPVLLMCATPSKRGGAVGLSHLKTALEAVGMFVYPVSYTGGEADRFLTADGFTQPQMQQRFARLLEEFAEFSRKLCA